MLELIRKFFVIPVILLGLSIFFIILSIMLSILKGNDNVLRKKLMIGGLILAFQGVAVQGVWSGGTCYERVSPEFVVNVESDEHDTIDLNIKETNVIKAMIRYGENQNFSFAVIADNAVIQWGIIDPKDGKMDALDEEVTFLINPEEVEPGTYELRIFWGNYENTIAILAGYPIVSYNLIIHSE